ncbi:glycosyltransferase family 39 protein [Starkeya koreensis]|uniref:Glycosyltransferase family 39 protein n=1 Tax=Ancylobacter koreensis TaxID=266121 RepID=A0ABT0DLB0_9HYPH|nr:glycosyltransferase family 39 protein [Ancylobacter koreensis]MCK0208040.1 glycosyltransferase family 39 protein [Ancylobacter koreensis]
MSRPVLPGFESGGRLALAVIAALLAWRLVLAASVPLVPDEAYYALWAQGLSAGYYDHPPMIAFFIRAGQMLAGDTALGVRLACVLSVVPASYFVWRAAALLLEDERAGPLAAVVFNATIFGFLGMTLATPDAPLALFSAAMVYCAASLLREPSPPLWLALGVATGLAMLSKYSGAMLGGGVGLAVLAVPELRRQLLRPWPWLALGLAILVFLPNLVWNAAHGWETFAKQGGRITAHAALRPGYVVEFVGSQVGLATPLVFVFAVAGLLPRAAGAFRAPGGRRLVLVALFVPLAYFFVHALRSRVEGNWVGFLYPLVAIAAAAGMLAVEPVPRRWVDGLRRATVPLALVFVLALGVHALAPLPGLGGRDPIARMTRGWPDFAAEVEALRVRTGAGLILTDNYQLAAMLGRELPGVTVEQLDERARYRFQNLPPLAERKGTALIVSGYRPEPYLEILLGPLNPVGALTRRFRGHDIKPLVRAYTAVLPPPAGRP